MNQLFKFIEKYKWDICSFGIVFIIFILYLTLFWGCFGTYKFDCGREAYLPQLLLQGKLLYKEIFAMYNPLSYQFNALLYLLFGTHLNTLYWAGAINTFFCILATYLISRQITTPINAGVIVLVFLSICITKLTNAIDYIFPYSYGMIYATSTFLFFTLFSILYVKYQKIQFAYISSLLLGISLANRFEYALAYLPFIVFFILKNKNIKSIIINVLLFLTPIIISYGILFYQGFTFSDLSNYITFGQRFFNTEEQQYFMRGGHSIFSLVDCFDNILVYTTMFIAMLAVNLIILKRIFKQKKILKYLLLITYFILFIFCSQIISSFFIHKYKLFCWIGPFLFYILYDSIKNPNIKNRILMILLSSIALLSCSRLGFVFIGGYSYYIMILPLIIVFSYIFSKLRKSTLNTLIIFLILFSIAHLTFIFTQKAMGKIAVETPKGTIYIKKNVGVIYNHVVQWISHNTNEKDTILILPENPLLNFLTERKTNDKYYHLIPNHISALDENKIVSDLNTEKPDYVILQTINYASYGKSYLGIDYGLKIYAFIKENYKIERLYKTNDNFELIIYSKK